MAEVLSIKERIERLYVSILQAVTGIGKIYRWDGRGMRDPSTGFGVDAGGQRLTMKNLDAMVIAGDETASEGGQGDIGTTIKKLPIEVHLKIVQSDDDAENGSLVHNRWLLRLEAAVMANPLMLEPSGNQERLATDTATTATGEPPREEGQRETITAIRFETQYEHYRNDPTAGAGITPFPKAHVLSVTDMGDNTLNVAFDGNVSVADFTAAATWLDDLRGNGGTVTTWTTVNATTLKAAGSGYLGPFADDGWSLVRPPAYVAAGQTGTIL